MELFSGKVSKFKNDKLPDGYEYEAKDITAILTKEALAYVTGLNRGVLCCFDPETRVIYLAGDPNLCEDKEYLCPSCALPIGVRKGTKEPGVLYHRRRVKDEVCFNSYKATHPEDTRLSRNNGSTKVTENKVSESSVKIKEEPKDIEMLDALVRLRELSRKLDMPIANEDLTDKKVVKTLLDRFEAMLTNHKDVDTVLIDVEQPKYPWKDDKGFIDINTYQKKMNERRKQRSKFSDIEIALNEVTKTTPAAKQIETGIINFGGWSYSEAFGRCPYCGSLLGVNLRAPSGTDFKLNCMNHGAMKIVRPEAYDTLRVLKERGCTNEEIEEENIFLTQHVNPLDDHVYVCNPSVTDNEIPGMGGYLAISIAEKSGMTDYKVSPMLKLVSLHEFINGDLGPNNEKLAKAYEDFYARKRRRK